MTDLTLVTYCGLYCGLCSSRKRIPQKAQDLKNSMAEEGYDTWGTGIPKFTEFWEFLNNLCDPETSCAGCRQGGGPPFCSIRTCCQQKNVDVCPFCEEYPCYRIKELGKGYPTLISDGKRMKRIGIEEWIEEQKKRVKTPFVYSDIRCYPYSVPAD
jgi:hypothetical protein